MKVNGQLEVAQLEQLTSDPSLLPTGRVWANIASPSAALPKFFDGTTVQTLQYKSTTSLVSQNSGTAVTVDWATGLYQQVILTGHAVISFTNPQSGQIHRLVVTQKTYNTTGTLYQYKLNMTDQDSKRYPYQPISALQPSENAYFSWYYSAGIRAAYATIPASIANPTSLPGTAATGIAISPKGDWLQIGQTGSPFVNNYPFFDGGTKASFGLKNVTANTAAAATVLGVDYSPDGNFFFTVGGTSPYLQGWHVLYPGMTTSTVLANPGTLPAGAGKCIAVHPSGSHVGVGHATSPFMSIYPYSGVGFGTKVADPGTLPAALVTSLAFSPTGDYLAAASQTTPFLQVWPFDPIAGTLGSICANPASLPTGGPAGLLGRGVAWRPQGDFIAMATTTSPQLYVTGFNRATGAFTSTQITDVPGANGDCVAWTPDGNFLILGLVGSPWLRVYDFSGQTLGTVLTYDGSSPGVAVNDVVISPNGEHMILALASSPFIMCYPLPQKIKNYLRL